MFLTCWWRAPRPLRFYDEARITRQISHANVCRVYDIGEAEGQPFLSMEYIDGDDLRTLLRRIGALLNWKTDSSSWNPGRG